MTDAARLSPGQSLQGHFSKGAAPVKVTRVNQALEGQEKDKEKGL
ncbi:MAG: hypothetical protein ACO271_08790 [Burkholderiales bacterium]